MTNNMTRRGFLTGAMAAVAVTTPAMTNAKNTSVAKNFADNFFAALPDSRCYKFRAHISSVTQAVNRLNKTLDLLCDQSQGGLVHSILISVHQSKAHRSRDFRNFSEAYNELLRNGNNSNITSLGQAGQSTVVIDRMITLAKRTGNHYVARQGTIELQHLQSTTRDLGYYELQHLSRDRNMQEIINHPLNNNRLQDPITFRRYQDSMKAIRTGRFDHNPDFRQELAFCSSFKTLSFLTEVTSQMRKNGKNYNLVKNLQNRASIIYQSQLHIVNPGRQYAQTCGTIFRAVSPN